MSESSSQSDGTPIVYDLDPECTRSDLEAGQYYRGTVNGVVEYGVFVDVSESVSGLIHESSLETEYAVGDDVIVQLAEIKADGDVSFEPAALDSYDLVEKRPSYDRSVVSTLADSNGDTVHLEGAVVQIKQTRGPTVFQVRDETGIVPCTAYEGAGVRSHPEVEVGDLVHVAGTVGSRNGGVQVEVDRLDVLDGDQEQSVGARLEAASASQSDPIEVEPTIDWPALDEMRSDLADIARQLRRAVLEGRPIRIRHHADGDGMCAAAPVEIALERLIEDVHEDTEAPRHLLKRLPSKAPYYEMEDATRDLNYSLGDRARHGQKLPVLLMIDNGSTAEDTPAYRTLDSYDIPVIVIDHHHPDPEAVDPYVDTHVNPYLYGEDYRITSGMLSVELARMLHPSLGDELDHVPAIAGLADRSKADAMSDYLELAAEAGYDESHLDDIVAALDYAAYVLRYDAGRGFVTDLLGIDDEQRHRELIDLLADRARQDTDRQLEANTDHVEHERLANGAHLYRLDLDEFAHRFTYPPPGKTTGELHDRKVEATGEPVITVGYGPDFAVLRSDGVRLDIPEMVTDLNDELPGAGVSGGGHLVVGSIRFVPGMREAVIDSLIEKMADAELDEALSSSST
ncbi:phosphoesterase RecJ domain protein [Halodesulfurarchaeum formicicum]|uniref:Phosphoesterase RecJ domain protein n=1 Tax=Halodesulfurarchaeum formicicum TaxID=1873524 RepID=A0A1D8S4Y1_9EURY|nr:OB-fold nucleic acid binding domain-containing protein [Halodesulfurarchaeum formicicum]AOW80416.1 phosphoesterase RecJ domain protein [Halodesulfurarchaeum formicicum]APE95754.1 phosphoesterase RecJ domain protein [Halodesulfurarchaeum formicicum]